MIATENTHREDFETMLDQKELQRMVEELVRIDRWSMKLLEMNENKESELFKELQDREKVLKYCIIASKHSIMDLDLNF